MTYAMTKQDVLYDPQFEWAPSPSASMGRLWSRTSKLKVVWDLVHAIGDWRDIKFSPDRCGFSISLGGVTLGHLDWNGRLDLPFGPEMRTQLVEEEMVSPDPRYPGAECVMFNIQSGVDVDRATWLLRLAYLVLDSATVDRQIIGEA